jgi:hypothetical protein
MHAVFCVTAELIADSATESICCTCEFISLRNARCDDRVLLPEIDSSAISVSLPHLTVFAVSAGPGAIGVIGYSDSGATASGARSAKIDSFCS